jgi:hypothetical protein
MTDYGEDNISRYIAKENCYITFRRDSAGMNLTAGAYNRSTVIDIALTYYVQKQHNSENN